MLALAALLFVVQGSSAADLGAAPAVPSEVSRLIPEDAVLFVYTESTAELTQSLSKLAASVNPQYAGMVAFMGPQTLLSQTVRTKAKFLGDQPAAIALSPGKTLEDDPIVTFIFAVEGATADTVKPKSKDQTLIFIEGTNWLATTSGPRYEPRSETAPAPSITSNMIPGSASLAFDQAALVRTHGTEMEAQLAAAMKDPGSPLPGIVGGETAKTIVEAVSRWNIAVDMEDSEVDLLLEYIANNPSWVVDAGQDLSPLASRLAGKLPMKMIVSKQILKWYVRLMDSVLKSGLAMVSDEKNKASMDSVSELFDDALKMVDEIELGAGQTVGFDEKGMDLVQVFKVRDRDSAFSMVDDYIAKINASNLGFEVERMRVLVGGETARAFKVKFKEEEFKKAFPGMASSMEGGPNMSDIMGMYGGADGLIFRIISNGNWMAVVAGAENLGRTRHALAQPSKAQPFTKRINCVTNGNIAMGMSMDYRSFMVGMMNSAEKDSVLAQSMGNIQLEPGPPAMLDMAVSSKDEATLLSIHADVGRIAKMFMEMEEASMKAAREKAEKEHGKQHDQGEAHGHESDGN
ncbi:MAG: hypothetical protein CMJ36_05115 [Phycisphaerae bacterium]|nr:hypothetical protein [Phycisphaerae bacterium]